MEKNQEQSTPPPQEPIYYAAKEAEMRARRPAEGDLLPQNLLARFTATDDATDTKNDENG